ncbi:DUF262 domain-containing protein [Bacteriovorax sp. Seq25_V]|uniref:DUF262 domain-containing protein n=1 Tax=Bacteriovorax sp. Seq25_V TaxID=1201288 RepID=UPI00038A372F|nr:DUF262 domain-containing protein [Bacteriovorax sp. Seq25_V]EQC47519.1 PF03235 family protein [Bacteriovorax sp. Seq25_V]
MTTKYDKFKIKDLIVETLNEKIVLPNFQRDFIWKVEPQQKKLIASVILKMPIGNWLFLMGEKKSFSFRTVGQSDSRFENSNTEEVKFLLDGQQRLSTICSCFSDLYLEGKGSEDGEWELIHEKTFLGLRNRWFLTLHNKNNENLQEFGLQSFNFNDLNGMEPFDLFDNLEVLKVNNKNKNKAGHPSLGNDYPGEAGEKLVKYCVENYKFPLYLVNGQHDFLKNRIIDGIADRRFNEMKDSDYAWKKKEAFISIMKNTRVVSPKEVDKVLEDRDVFIKKLKGLSDVWADKLKNYFKEIMIEEVPVTLLPITEIERAASIFDTMNTAGTPLSTFDLFSAKWAKSSESTLGENIRQSLEKLEEEAIPSFFLKDLQSKKKLTFDKMNLTSSDDSRSLEKVIKDQFLNLLSLNNTRAENLENNEYKRNELEAIKRTTILQLNTSQIDKVYKCTIQGLYRANLFCFYRLGIGGIINLPYTLMILPIAILLAEDKNWNSEKIVARVELWYWVSIFSGHYRDSQNRKAIEDIEHLQKYSSGDVKNFEKRREDIFKNNGYSKLENFLPFDEKTGMREMDLDSCPGAIVSSFLAFQLRKTPRFIIKNTKKMNIIDTIDDKLEKHHLIPLGSTVDKFTSSTSSLRKDKNNILNSVLNLAYVTSSENRSISDMKINEYIKIDNFPLSDYYLQDKIFKTEDWKSKPTIYQALKSRFHAFEDAVNKHLVDLENTID